MLWDLIRDFFVMHVFGGMTSDEVRYIVMGGGIYSELGTDDEEFYVGTLNDLIYHIDNNGNSICLSDWLSTTATAISITLIVVLCCLFVYRIIKLIGGLIR